MPGQAVKHANDCVGQLAQIDPFGGQVQPTGFDTGDVQDVTNQFQEIFGRVVRHLDGGPVQLPLVGPFEGEFQQADYGIHRGANFVAHRCQESTFGAVCFVGPLFGGPQFVHQLATVTDINPATDDALNLAQRIPVRQYPVIDGDGLIAYVQLAVHDQWRAFSNDTQII